MENKLEKFQFALATRKRADKSFAHSTANLYRKFINILSGSEEQELLYTFN